MDNKQHWERVYGSKAPDAVSWYAPHLETSLKLIHQASADKSAAIIDIGGGESTLVDDLLSEGYEDISVLDISQKAIDVARDRIGKLADKVHWYCADITQATLPQGYFDVWHDRAVFHFLTEEAQRARYVEQVMRSVKPVDSAAYVIIGLLANTLQAAERGPVTDPRLRRTGMTNSISFHAEDILDCTIPELMTGYGYFKECAEFKNEYETHSKRFMQMQPKFGAQFTVSGNVWMSSEGPRPQLECMRLQAGTTARCVNDEELLERHFDTTADATFWRSSGISEGFERIPQHCYLYLFHLDYHCNVWVHVQNVQVYCYKPELRDKLVLPHAHRELIDILTADRNFLMEDIVEGKSGGTTILCKGAPGLGKTLTAEVYAEVVQKPLYRVHSGQLGVTASSVETNLSKILRRAARWDSVLLLDEADVYIRRRDNDLQHNAIVAEFLRTLEYFNGLLFMTTNRVADIDDAVLSRCIAIIQFEIPTQEQAKQLWKSLAQQFNTELPDGLVECLAITYADASGRDIKELLKLTLKFCKGRNLSLSEEVFAQCAAFRSIGKLV